MGNLQGQTVWAYPPSGLKYTIKQHHAACRRIACLCCGQKTQELHHPRDLALGCGAGMKADDWLVIPLCMKCHNEFHRIGKRKWEEKHGTQANLVRRVFLIVKKPCPLDIKEL